MSHIEDDDLPIRSKTSQAYRDNWDRIFGEEPALKTGENTEDVADAPLPPQTPAEAVKEYLANGGEPSPIGWYGVVNVPDKCPSCGQAFHGDDLCGDLKR